MKTYRLLRVMSVYRSFAMRLEARFAVSAPGTYAEALALVEDSGYGVTPDFPRYLAMKGWETATVYLNIPTLQRLWAMEHAIPHGGAGLNRNVLLHQIKDFDPEVAYLEDLATVDPTFRTEIRRAAGTGVRLVGWRGVPARNWEEFRDLDLVLSCADEFVKEMQAVGVQARYLPLGFNEELSPMAPEWSSREIQFSFLGSLGWENGIHSSRWALMERLLPETDLQVWGESGAPTGLRRLILIGFFGAFSAARIMAPWSLQSLASGPLGRVSSWSRIPNAIPPERRWPGRVNSPVYGRDYLRILGQSKLTLNSHIDAAVRSAANARLFEATGMGACLLTDRKKNLRDFFEVDREVVDYGSADELVAKVRELERNDSLAREIARAGQSRTAREHSHAARADLFANLIADLEQSSDS